MPEPRPSDAPEIAGFTHLRLLGSGGFADVHLYQQRFPRRRVAIKVLHVENLDRELRRQFVAEANVMAQLSTHPAIATIHTADVSADGRPYLVMEYCSGGSLGAGYRTHPLELEAVLDIGVRMASALESAHRAGIVHRDVKPANILVTDYGAPVLTDFGISMGEEGLAEATVFRTQHTTATMTTGNAGTTQGLSVPWAPPEAFDDIPVSDARSDVYSLGATLFSLLEGRSPFELPGGSNGALHLSRRIERGEIVPAERDLPADVIELLLRTLAVSPADRPQSAQELGTALQDLQRAHGATVTPFDVVTVAADAVAEADMQTRVRSAVPNASEAPASTERLPAPQVAQTRIRTPAPASTEPAPPAEASALRWGMSRLQLGIAAAIGVGVLLLSGTGIAIAVSLATPRQVVADQPVASEEPEPAVETSEPEPLATVPIANYQTDKAPSSFIADPASAYRDPGLLGESFSGVHFVSPSKNLGCVISGADLGNIWGCYADVAWWTWPDGPDDYCYDPAEVVGCSSGIEASMGELPHPRRRGDVGWPATMSVVNGNMNKAPYTLPILAYDHSVTYGDITCYSEYKGMTCVDATTGHGFTIAKDLNKIF
jgi:serine/threonine protein kinase